MLTILKTARPCRMPRLSLLALLLVAFTALGSLAETPPAAGTVPIIDCDGLPCVNLTFPGGVQARFALDTGDPQSILDLAFAKSIHADIQPYKTPDGKDYPGIFVAKISGVMFGTLPLGDMKFLVADLGGAMSGQDTLKLDGSLGLPAYADRMLTVDYPAHTATLTAKLTSAVACPSVCGTLANIKFGTKGPPILVATSGFAVNGKPVSLQVDTMYSGSIVIYDASIDKLGLTDLAHSTTAKEHFAHTDGGVDMLHATAQSESFGGVTLAKDAPLYFPSKGVHQPDGLFDGTVGAALLGKFRVTLDFFDHKMWIN